MFVVTRRMKQSTPSPQSGIFSVPGSLRKVKELWKQLISPSSFQMFPSISSWKNLNKPSRLLLCPDLFFTAVANTIILMFQHVRNCHLCYLLGGGSQLLAQTATPCALLPTWSYPHHKSHQLHPRVNYCCMTEMWEKTQNLDCISQVHQDFNAEVCMLNSRN